MQDISNWNIFDSHSGTPIGNIEPMSARAISLLARNKNGSLLKNGYINVRGAIDIMDGLCYHFANIERIYAASGAFRDDNNMDHEVVSYFNRMGQFYYFVNSDFVKAAIPNGPSLIPTINEMMVFRNKHSSHRSIDAPRKETDEEKESQARALSSTFGYGTTPKPGSTQPTFPQGDMSMEVFEKFISETKKNSNPCYQTFDGNQNKTILFVPQVDHPKIIAEAYGILEQLILYP